MKLNLPKEYVSWSQFWLFNEDPIEYYQQYFVCPVDRVTPKMTLGKIFQLAWCDPLYDYKANLRSNGFTSNFERIMTTALTHKDTIRIKKSETEKKITTTKAEEKKIGLDYKVLGQFDGLVLSKNLLIENKFGVVWSQERADTDRQLTWYSLLVYLRFGFVPEKIALQSFNSKTGIPNVRYTKRSIKQIKELVIDINSMVARVHAGDFQKR